MYHCHIQFYLVGLRSDVWVPIREMPPLERFTHAFSESSRPEPELAGAADVILADLRDVDALQTMMTLVGYMKQGAELILLADGEHVLPEGMPDQVRDIWPFSALHFRFRRWQENYKRERDLWQASQFLDTAMNSSPSLIWFKDLQGIHEKVNDSFCQAVEKSRDQVEGKTHARIWNVAHEDPACIESELEAIRRRETFQSHEIITTGDGGEKLLTTYKSPLYDLDGSVMGTVGIGFELPRERNYEQEIMEKNRTMELLFSTMDCGVIYHSLDGKQLVSVNRAALWLLGYETQEELLANGFDLVARSVLEEDKPRLREAIHSLKTPGETATVEYRVRHPDGSIVHILGNVKLVKRGGELFYQRLLLDFTAQKLQEEAKWAQRDREMQYQERMFEIFSTFLSDNIDDVYMMLDEKAEKVEFVSPNIERVLGISREEAVNDLRQLGDVKYLSGKEISLEDLQALEPGMFLETIGTERVNPRTGEHGWFRESVYCVSLQEKKRIIVYISDRTRERKSEDTLREALEIAQVANKAKSTFLSNVSHDIRTPMNAIMGFVALLKEEADNKDRVVEYTQKIAAASQHLLGLINDVLDMNKIESGSAVLNISEMNLAEVIDELNTIIRPQAKAKDQTFEIFAEALTQEDLLGDKLRINQILINILSNAVKYTQTGGVIQMRVRELPRVDEHYSRIQFTVQDNGQGMSEDYQQLIFDPFTREQSTLLNKIQGTGLGMAITKSLVDLMGGKISVASKLGEGSTFTVELELRVQETDNDPNFWDQHGIHKILVAEDDEDICKNIVRKMSASGVHTDYATDGGKAVEMIQDAQKAGQPYDLILLDWKMPELDGLETAKQIRKSGLRKVPILLFTAYDWSEIKQDALGVGIEHFLPKPFFITNFKDTIRRMRESQKNAQQAKKSVVNQKRILVVDDMDVNRMILVKILTTLGAVCDTAENGQEAVEKFEASQPGEYDLILMDIQMPVMNGYEATRAIRAGNHPSAQSVAIIAITANAFVEDIRNALDAGMDAHMAKPVVLDTLNKTIQDVLDRKEHMSCKFQPRE